MGEQSGHLQVKHNCPICLLYAPRDKTVSNNIIKTAVSQYSITAVLLHFL